MQKKKEEKLGKCGIVLFLHNEDDKWYIDNVCSHHMLGDSSIFFFFNRTKSFHVAFKGNEPTRVLGKGKDKLGERNTNANDVWLVQGLKHNILSIR